jgi:(1->4)-alpha-D-glucan 1-alpha-D-glucosylmutase
VFGAEASYRPLFADGACARHAVAYARHASTAPEGRAAITCVTRLPRVLGGDWRGTRLRIPDGRWRDVLTGARHDGGPIPMETLLAELPVALCCREERG